MIEHIPIPHCFDCPHAEGIWCKPWEDVQTELYLECDYELNKRSDYTDE